MSSSRAWRNLEYFSIITINGLIWSISYYFARATGLEDLKGIRGDLLELLFGAASLALFVISIVIGIIAVVGIPYIMNEVRKSAQEEIKEATQPLSGEMRGRVLSSIGYLRGEASINHEQFEVLDKRGLAEAITLCEQAHELLKKIEGPAEFQVLNNLIYYCCVLNYREENSYRSRSDFLLSNAHRLLEAAKRHKSISPQLTACRAILQFGKSRKERIMARDMLIDIKMAIESSEDVRREAQQHLHHTRQMI